MRKTSPLNGVLLSGKIYKWLVKKEHSTKWNDFSQDEFASL